MSSRSQARDGYRAPAGIATGELREKGSRFLAELVPVTSGESATGESAAEALRSIERRYAGATHHCWASRLGWPPVERSADAGEPAGTAGAPILRVLQGGEVSDALLVVTRWFGGVKLGKGGLARAYAAVAGAAVANASFVERIPRVEYSIRATYGRMGPMRRVLATPGVNVVRQAFGEWVEIEVAVEAPGAAAFEAAIADLGLDVGLSRINRPASP